MIMLLGVSHAVITRSRGRVSVPALMLGALVGTSSASGQVDTRLFVASGSAVPGVVGQSFSGFGTPSVNADGSVAFKGSYGGQSGVFAGRSTTLSLVAGSGQTPPGVAGTGYADFDDPLIAGTGAVAFTATLGAGSTFQNNRVAVFSTGGASVLLGRTGDAPPGTFNEEVFASFDMLRLGANGHAALYATLSGPFVDSSNNVGIWSGLGVLSAAARTGDLTLFIPGTLYTSLGLPTINASGQLAFTAVIAGSGVSTTNDQLVARGLPNAISTAVREGQQAPNQPAGIRYGPLGAPAINAAGNLAFSGNLRGTGITAFNDAAAWSNAGGPFAQIVRSGEAAPGLLNTSLSIPGFPRINAYGRVVLLSALTGGSVNSTNDLALWTNVPGAITLVAVKGAAGVGAGGATIAGFGGAVINSQGTILYRATLTGAGVDSSNNTALYAWDKLGTRLVVRTGATLNVGGVNKVVSGIRTALDTGNQDGKPSSMSERGQVVYQATFTDGSSAILSASVTRCPADLTSVGGVGAPDGVYTVDDTIAFFNAFADGNLFADIAEIGGVVGGDGQLTADDVIGFVNALSDGCAL